MCNYMKFLMLISLVLLIGGCSPLSRQAQRQAVDVPFETLLAETEQYQGEAVVLGGYIVQTRVLADRTEIVVLQVPLGVGDRPRERDRAYGRFLVIHDSYLDPEVYARNRAVTVAGNIIGRETERTDICPRSCLVISSREFHLWREERYHPPRYDPFFHDPFWGVPSFRRPFHPRYPFWGHPWYYDPWGW
jgi:outer membrane lipoprotein